MNEVLNGIKVCITVQATTNTFLVISNQSLKSGNPPLSLKNEMLTVWLRSSPQRTVNVMQSKSKVISTLLYFVK